MTAAAIYARVSSSQQAKHETIGSQLDALREHAERSRLDVPDEWVFADEGHSGATLARPALDPRNFHRKATTTPGFVAATGTSITGERGRPAQLYRKGSAALLHPPLLRPGAADAESWPAPAHAGIRHASADANGPGEQANHGGRDRDHAPAARSAENQAQP